MTSQDIEYLQLCYDLKLVNGRFLDVGSMKVNEGLTSIRDVARGLGLQNALGTDFREGPGVDIIMDFSRPREEFVRNGRAGSFDTVAVFNVLEHTFDPVTVLSNALSLVAPGGTLLALTPSIWPIHNYPIDCIRLNPDWYRQFAATTGTTLVDGTLSWISPDFGIKQVEQLREDGLDYYPNFWKLGPKSHPSRYRLTVAINRLLPSFYRSNWHPVMVALGGVFRVPEGARSPGSPPA